MAYPRLPGLPLLALLVCAPASAEWLDDQRRTCVEDADFQRRVEACSWLVNAPGLDPLAVAEAHYFRAIARTGLGQHRAALGDASEALERDPASAVYHFFRAYVHANLARRRDAIADIDEALRLGFDKPAEAWGFRGELHMDLGEYEQAVRDAERSLAAAPGLRAAMLLHEMAFTRLRGARCDEYETAAAAARQALADGELDVARRQSEIALATHRRAADFAHDHPPPGGQPAGFACETPRWRVLVGLGRAQLAAGRPSDASGAFELALRADDGAGVHHAVAEALAEEDDLTPALRARALSSARRAVALQRTPEHLRTLAAVEAAGIATPSASDASPAAGTRAAGPASGDAAGEPPVEGQGSSAGRATAMPVTPATTPAAGEGVIRDEAWVLAQPPGNWTVQLLATVDEARLHEALGREALPGETGMFHQTRDGQAWYTAVHGSFASRAEADAAAAELARSHGHADTWVRRFAGVHEAIRAR